MKCYNYKGNTYSETEILQLIQDNVIVNDQLQFQILGEQGATTLDQKEEATYRIDNLNVAREMEEVGKSAKEIRLSTGWERGADSKWRYEILDGDLIINEVKKNTEYSIQDVMSKTEDIGDLKIIVLDENEFKYGNAAKYNPIARRIEINARVVQTALDSSLSIREEVFLPRALRQTILHEVQHHRQRVEGFYGGGNLSTVAQRAAEIVGVSELATNEELKTGIDTKLNEGNLSKIDRDILLAVQDLLKARTDIEQNIKLGAVYERISGEVEARNVETRMNMSAEERRQTLLSETEDVAREDQIFITDAFGNQESRVKVITNGFLVNENGQENVYVNTNAKNPTEALLHEYSHSFLGKLKQANPEMYQRGIELARSVEAKEISDFIKVNQPNLIEGTEAFANEVLAEISGRRAFEILSSKEDSEIKTWLQDFFDWIRSKLGLTQMTNEQVATLSLEGYADAIGVDLMRGEELFQEKEAIKEISKDKLLAVHNISVSNLLNVDKQGGLAVPSIAVINTDFPFTSFGEITLVADKSLIDPKVSRLNKAFASDSYSIRYPSITYTPNPKKLREFNERVKKELPYLDERDSFRNVGDRGRVDIENDNVTKLLFLKEQGKEKDFVFRESEISDKYLDRFEKLLEKTKDSFDFTREDGKVYQKFSEIIKEKAVEELKQGNLDEFEFNSLLPVVSKVSSNDYYAFRQSLNARKNKELNVYKTLDKNQVDENSEEYQNLVDEIYDNLEVTEQIFKSYTPSGNRRYVPHTIENVVRMMKGGARKGEGFFYGVGSVRAGIVKQFKSIKDIKDSQDKIVSSEEFEKVKEEINNEFLELGEKLKPFYKYQTGSFGYFDNVGESLIEFYNRGRSQDFNKLDKETEQEVKDFLEKLYNLPTEYFEVKIERAVDLSEFKGALLPQNTPQKIKDILTKAGLKTVEYTEGKRDLSEFQDLKFQQQLEEYYKRNAGRLPLTLSVFGKQPFQDLQGKQVNPVTVQQLLNKSGIKQIEKDLINQVIADNYQGQKRISYDELEATVRANIMPLERLTTSSYARYGMDRLGGGNYGKAKTLILNSPLEHGVTGGHFSGDFKASARQNIKYVPKQLNDNTWVAVEEGYESQANDNNIYQFVGTAGTKESVDAWIENYEKPLKTYKKGDLIFKKENEIYTLKDDKGVLYSEIDPEFERVYGQDIELMLYQKLNKSLQEQNAEVNKGMFGHIRVWQDGEVFHVAELQSDYFQKQYVVEDMTQQVINSDKHSFTKENKDRYNSIYKDMLSYRRDYFTLRDQFKEAGVTDKVSLEKLKEKENNYKDKRKQYYNEVVSKAQPLFEKDQKQFIASQKIWEQRMVREAIKEASLSGVTSLRFPTPYTLSVIEGYIRGNEATETAPYQILEGDSNSLKEGDVVNYLNKEYIIVEANENAIKIVEKAQDDITQEIVDDIVVAKGSEQFIKENKINDDIYIYKGFYLGDKVLFVEKVKKPDDYETNDKYFEEGLFESQNLTRFSYFEKYREEIENVFGKMTDKEFSEFIEEADTLQQPKVNLSLENASKDFNGQFELPEYSPTIDEIKENVLDYTSSYRVINNRVYSTESVETLKQPDKYTSQKSDGFDIATMLSEEEQTVARKYEQIAEILKQERGEENVEIVTDENGFDWYETKISEEETQNPVIAFQQELEIETINNPQSIDQQIEAMIESGEITRVCKL